MPAVYVSGTFVGVVELQDKDYPYSDWTNIELAKEREGYDRPNLALWLEIPNKEEPISPFSIPVTNRDVYDGEMKCTQDGMKFTFEFSGKAKVNVTKETKAAVDAGEKPKPTGIMINGAEAVYETDSELTLVV